MSRHDSELMQYSAAILPGKGSSPGYGINESGELSNSNLEGSGQTTPSVIQSLIHPPSRERVWAVAMCSLIACIQAMNTGMVFGYSSPTIASLSDDPNPNHRIYPDKIVASLIGGFGVVGAIFGGPVAWPLSDKYGRQATLMMSGIPSLIGWLCIANAHIIDCRIGFIVLLLIGRLLTGVTMGWALFGISVYIAEVASPKLRGLFGNCNELFVTLGVLITSVLGIKFNGYQVPYWYVALLAGGLVVVFEFLMLFTYETPRWFFSKGNAFQGIHVLKILRGPKAHITEEINRIRHSLQRTYTFKEQLYEFKQRSVYMPFVIVLFLVFFQQFSGIDVVLIYAIPILNSLPNPGLTAALAVGVTQVIATFVAVVLVDLLGRRILLVISSTGMALSCFTFSVYLIYYDRVCHKSIGKPTSPDSPPCNYEGIGIGIIAIVSIIVFIASFSLGWGPIPWSIMSELMPNRVRTLAVSIATSITRIFTTIIIFGFYSYADLVTPEFAWLTFGIIMVVSIIFVLLFLPETKGRSLEEIQDHFEFGEIFALSCLHRKPQAGKSGHGISREHLSRIAVTSVSPSKEN